MKLFITVFIIMYSICIHAQEINTSLLNPATSNLTFAYLFKRDIQSNPYFLQYPVLLSFPHPSSYLKIDHAPGLFCKIECKIEAKANMLPRFRLGSADYTDWMEGKRRRYD